MGTDAGGKGLDNTAGTGLGNTAAGTGLGNTAASTGLGNTNADTGRGNTDAGTGCGKTDAGITTRRLWQIPLARAAFGCRRVGGQAIESDAEPGIATGADPSATSFVIFLMVRAKRMHL